MCGQCKVTDPIIPARCFHRSLQTSEAKCAHVHEERSVQQPDRPGSKRFDDFSFALPDSFAHRDEMYRVYLTSHCDGLSTKSFFNHLRNGLDCLENVGDLLSGEVAQSWNNALRDNKYIWTSMERIKLFDHKSYLAHGTYGQARSDANSLDQKRAGSGSYRKPSVAPRWREPGNGN